MLFPVILHAVGETAGHVCVPPSIFLQCTYVYMWIESGARGGHITMHVIINYLIMHKITLVHCLATTRMYCMYVLFTAWDA